MYRARNVLSFFSFFFSFFNCVPENKIFSKEKFDVVNSKENEETFRAVLLCF